MTSEHRTKDLADFLAAVEPLVPKLQRGDEIAEDELSSILKLVMNYQDDPDPVMSKMFVAAMLMEEYSRGALGLAGNSVGEIIDMINDLKEDA